MKILIINGPNLNLIGQRETKLYGNIEFTDFLELLEERFPNLEIGYFQSNIEGELIDRIQEANLEVDGIVINAGGYTHTSVAIADAIRTLDIPVIEVHITNILAREEFRHVSLLSPNCIGSIFGFGLDSYRLALRYFSN